MSLGHMDLVTFLTLVILLECIRGLKLLELEVPAHVHLGTRSHLSCRWALEPSELLYAVKWYKDGREFFRHVPGNQEPQIKFKLPGVDVEAFESSGTNLTLSPASLQTSGRYRCEVSGEKPLFPTVSEHADMEVIVLPDRGPVLSGLRPRYKTGECVKVTCTSGRSWPATELGWYINGEPAPLDSVRPAIHQKDDQGLESTKLILDFVISEKHFIDNRMKVKCLATLSPFYWRSNEESTMKQRVQIYPELEVMSARTVEVKNFFVHRMTTATNSGYNPGVIAATIRLGTTLCFALNIW